MENTSSLLSKKVKCPIFQGSWTAKIMLHGHGFNFKISTSSLWFVCTESECTQTNQCPLLGLSLRQCVIGFSSYKWELVLFFLLADGLFLLHSTLNEAIGWIYGFPIMLIQLKLQSDPANLIGTKRLRDLISIRQAFNPFTYSPCYSTRQSKHQNGEEKVLKWLVSRFDVVWVKSQHSEGGGLSQDLEPSVKWELGNMAVDKSTAAV